ncbi:MAG: alkaline phosphatase family protein, partial [Rhabdochlamydiaceae bacterium]
VYGNLPISYTFTEAYNDWKTHKPLPWKPTISEKRLWSISDHKFPGWCLTIPDQSRADEFISDYKSRIKQGITPPDLTILYLEQDHTSGEARGMPTPQAMNADNDYAIERADDAVSHSKYWKSTVIFIIEDDPQDGYDHIDGHRSICLAVSPYSQGNGINRTYYDQAALLHTIEAFLHIPPMTRFDRNAPIMTNCFGSTPNLAPYNAIAPKISLTTLNGSGHQTLQFAYPDESNDQALNHQIWDSIYPHRPYPAQYCPPPDEGDDNN